MLTSVVGVVVLLGGLIFFHESGHYLIAKLFGVKVEVFSLGFGKKLFRRQIGETEYALSLFPLGGYVKLMGDDPYKGVPAAEAHRAFSTQKLYKRFLIVSAGPIANLLLAYTLFIAVFYFGQPKEGTRLGRVLAASPAYEAGLRARDKITEVNGVSVFAWSDLEDILKDKVGSKVDLTVERNGTTQHVAYPVGKVRERNPYGEEEEVGGIKGIAPNALEAMIGISNTQSAAYKAGIRTGDVIVKVGARDVILYEDMKEAFASEWSNEKTVPVVVKRGVGSGTATTDQTVNLTFPKAPPAESVTPLGAIEALGIFPSELFVFKVTPNSPAEKGGLQPGDRIARIGTAPIFNFESIVDAVQDLGGKNQTVNLNLEREGQTVILNLKPIETTQEDPLTRQSLKKYLLGFVPQTALHEAELVKFKIREPIALVKHAVGETNLLAKRMLISILKLVTGSISVKNLGGPVLIASVAGKSLDAGIIPFLQMMALISINLFLLNLFPIPVLDGGHLLFFIVEGIKGKPVSIRTMEIANQIGMVFILMLVGLTLFNDISRIILH